MQFFFSNSEVNFDLKECLYSLDTGQWFLRANTSLGTEVNAQLSLKVYANEIEHQEERMSFKPNV